jgi:class 3 adenylate cyclase
VTTVELTVACRSDVRALWDALADTERLNRALGMDRITVEPLRDGTAARHLVHTRLNGFPVVYEELPFAWIYPRSFQVVRRVRSGPLRQIELGYVLEPAGEGGTMVRMRLALTPRYDILGPFVRFMGGRTRQRFAEAIRQIDAATAQRKDASPRPGGSLLAAHRSEIHQEAFRRADEALRAAEGARPGLVDRLVTFVRDAADFDVSRIRPYALADGWGEDRRAVLGVCLSAVRAGLLVLRWEVVCPSCRTASSVLPSLAAISDHGVCHLCDLEFTVDLEDAVEATFTPTAAVREVDTGPYCIGGPARTPHVVAQAILPPEGEARLACPAEEGRYRIFLRGGISAPVTIEAGAPSEQRFGADAAPITVAPAGSIVVENPVPEERHVKLEHLAWVDQAARARVVTAMPGFRRDFSHDVLRPGMALEVARVGIFFSDLTGSTQLYATAGDAAAFKLVHDHFDVVTAILEENRGTLIKTIGDAVMAVFADELDGLLASVALLHAFEDFRKGGEHRERTHIKLGVFGGPCYVVTANGVLDYFGQTVNVAARLQGEARSGELVVEEALADRALERNMLPEGFVVERYDARLKGVAAPIRVARIRLPQG